MSIYKIKFKDKENNDSRPIQCFIHGFARGWRDPGVHTKTGEQALRYLTLELKQSQDLFNEAKEKIMI